MEGRKKVKNFSDFMSKYIIEGGTPLRGEFSLAGAKNAALKLIVASVLTPEPVVIQNVPKISDVDDLLESLQFLGAEAFWSGEHEVTVRAEKIKTKALPLELACKNRCTFLIFGALLGRFGEAAVPDPGGCKIGRRPVDRHILGFEALGAKIKRENGFYVAKKSKPQGGEFRFEKNSHTGTENLILAATLSKGKTRILNAAQEPEIDNLIGLLLKMGAQIKRIEPRIIEIEGVEKLSGATIVTIPDRIELATIAVAAAITQGDVLLKGANSADCLAFFKKLGEVGVFYQVIEEGVRVWMEKGRGLHPVEIETRPHPGFMTDWLSPFAVLLTQALGESKIVERIYPNRFSYLVELKKMGAEVSFFNPKVENPAEYYDFNPEDDDPAFFHGAKIFGPTKLSGTQLDASDIRAGAALVIAALSAKGQFDVSGVEHIERGYEDLVGKLKNLGANIKKEE